MARLRPGIRVQEVEKTQGPVGHALKHFERIAAPQADVAQMLVADVAERGGDSVEERLGADETVVGKHVGAIGEMLAGAEADLEMERPVVAEQRAGGDFAFGGDFDLREQGFDKLLLRLAELVPARPSIEAVEGQRVAGLERGHR